MLIFLQFFLQSGVVLFFREFSESPEKLIKNGRPLFGTYSGNISKLDIKGVKKPFGIIPVPPVFTNIAIRSHLILSFNAGDYIGQVCFFDAKLFGYAELVYWNKNTNLKYAYNTFTGPRKRLVPKNLQRGIAVSFKKARYLRISWDRQKNRFSLLVNMKGDSLRPDTRAHFSCTAQEMTDLVTVMPAPTSRRCSATLVSFFPLRGALSTVKSSEIKAMEQTDGMALMTINRSYYKLHARFNTLTATGMHNGKKIALFLATSSIDSKDTNKCNPNTLFLNGEMTLLPQVFVTHPFGMDKIWNIQDTENMVDLTFSPVSENLRKMNTVIFRTIYHTIYGTFEGTLLTKDGESISVKNLSGIIQTTMLRL